MATLTVYPDLYTWTNDTICWNASRDWVNENFATIRGWAWNAVDYTSVEQPVKIISWDNTNLYEELSRVIMTFDTSTLLATAEIQSASLFLYWTYKLSELWEDDLYLTPATPASSAILVNADYGQALSWTSYGSIAYGSYSVVWYNEIVLNATWIAAISLTANTKIAARLDWDRQASFGGSWVTDFKETWFWISQDTSQRPKLVIEYKYDFLNANYVYIDDANYATTTTAADWDIWVQLSKDAWVNWSSIKTETFWAWETTETYWDWSTELWGTSWTWAEVNSATDFMIRVTAWDAYNGFKAFGFAIWAAVVLTWLEVTVKAKYTWWTTSINYLAVKVYYWTSLVPITWWSQTYVSDWRKAWEWWWAWTWVLCFYDEAWIWAACDTWTVVQA